MPTERPASKQTMTFAVLVVVLGLGAASLLLPAMQPGEAGVQEAADAAALAGAVVLSGDRADEQGSVATAIDVAREKGLRLYRTDVTLGRWDSGSSTFARATGDDVNALQVDVNKFVFNPGFAQIILRFDANTMHANAIAVIGIEGTELVN